MRQASLSASSATSRPILFLKRKQSATVLATPSVYAAALAHHERDSNVIDLACKHRKRPPDELRRAEEHGKASLR